MPKAQHHSWLQPRYCLLTIFSAHDRRSVLSCSKGRDKYGFNEFNEGQSLNILESLLQSVSLTWGHGPLSWFVFHGPNVWNQAFSNRFSKNSVFLHRIDRSCIYNREYENREINRRSQQWSGGSFSDLLTAPSVMIGLLFKTSHRSPNTEKRQVITWTGRTFEWYGVTAMFIELSFPSVCDIFLGCAYVSVRTRPFRSHVRVIYCQWLRRQAKRQHWNKRYLFKLQVSSYSSESVLI